jgi:hypothetical protein
VLPGHRPTTSENSQPAAIQPGWRRRRRRAVLSDLAVLTPPAVVCAALLIAIVAFLRREMGPRRSGEDEAQPPDISVNDQIGEPKISEPGAQGDDGIANDPPSETGHRGSPPRQ